MLSSLRKLLGAQYHPLNTIEISQEHLLHNYTYLSSFGYRIAPVLKSNAYGHGLLPIAQILDNVGAPFFCVDSLYEAYELQKARIQTPILIMGYVHPDTLKVKRLPFSFAVYSREMLETLKRYQPQAPLHIFVDSGMHREGVALSELSTLLHDARQWSLHIEGLMSHLAMADHPQDVHTRSQVKIFQEAMEHCRRIYPHVRYTHLAASSGLLSSAQYPKLGTVARGGISLYGIDPAGQDEELLPVAQLTSTIVQLKIVKKGEAVGYDFAFTARSAMNIALLPIGYHDGVDRRLSNIGVVTIRGHVCPIVGKVSMNLTTIDVSSVPDAKVGDTVIIFSNQNGMPNSIWQAAETCQTVPYELLIHLIPSTKRTVV